ncbi:WD40-repeat-containing domain protein [Amanita muscaria]
MSIIPAVSNTSNQTSPAPKLRVAGVHVESAHFTGGGHTFGNNSVVNNTFISGDGRFTDVQRNLICDHIANLTVLPHINDNLNKHILTQSIISLPRAEAVFNDYQTKKKSGPCFEGTRVALLREMADWATGTDESRMYILSGLAGIGKSTVAYTVASRAADLNLLGASFFFSRDEADRKNAKKFFCTIAYQLCVYNESFAKAIGDVLLTERGSAATTKDLHEQLNALILDPLRNIVQSRARPILVVVDALDECDEDDEKAVVMGLSQLVRQLPSFKIILTTRPQPLVNYLLDNHDGHKIFRLQDIEDKIVDGDIRLYLSYSLSQEQVRARLRNPKGEWCASDDDIESLVEATGRLFIIASTAVLYVLNNTLGDPGARMKKLLSEILQDRTPFHALNHFYSVIVRSAFQADDEDDDIVKCYQIIVGTIVILQTPLPVATLACLVSEESEKIYGMLRNLQSVILLGSDEVPRIYHKSFPDFLTNQARCKDPHLRIDPRMQHTWLAIRCMEIMNKELMFNILGLGDVTRFMSNKDGLKEDGITDEQVQKKIPEELRYACVYWANHLEAANIEDVDLMNRLEKFADEHMLYWLEVLSLIGKLDLAHHAIRIVLRLLKSTASDLHQLLSDALRFISKFYEVVKRSALHTYYSALPFTPSDSLLYRRYSKQAVDNNVKIFGIEGGPETWGAVVADLRHGDLVNIVKFSPNSALLASCCEANERDAITGMLKIWDAVTGTPISTISGDRFAVANDFSTVASSKDNIITYYNTNGGTMGTMLTTSSRIQVLALSESSRIAAALSDGTVLLWESRNAEIIDSFDEFDLIVDKLYQVSLKFSFPGTRLAYSSVNGIVKLRDGISGRFIADLQCGSANLWFDFSGDGSRIASLSRDCTLTLWNSEGGLIGAAGDIIHNRIWFGNPAAISGNGSLLATGDRSEVTLWSGNNSLAQIEVLELDMMPVSMTFSPDNILTITTLSDVKLYNVTTHSFIFTLSFSGSPQAVAFSPDYSRFAIGYSAGSVRLCDIQAIDASGPPSIEEASEVNHRVNALALSRDCSQLACGFSDGTVELWETSPTKRRIASHHGHPVMVTDVEFRPDVETGRYVERSLRFFSCRRWHSRTACWSQHGKAVSLCGVLTR